MGLSSNVIWHQTNYNGLKAILMNRELKCSYSKETISWKSSQSILAFPMISFSGVPLADTNDYLGQYGGYVIGFKRAWVEKHRVSPVWYRDKNAYTLRIQMEAFNELIKKDHLHLSDMGIVYWSIIAYSKNTIGALGKYGFKSYRFLNENEIRYVPSYEDLTEKGIKPLLLEDEYEEYKEKKGGSALIDDLGLRFGLSDIDYILISEANQYKRVRDLLGNQDDANRISILSYDQVRKDIMGIAHNVRKKKNEKKLG